MEKDYKGSLSFKQYFVNYINFKSNKEIVGNEIPMKLNLSCELGTLQNNIKLGKVTLTADVLDMVENHKAPFELRVSISGIFENVNLDQDKFSKMLGINGVALLYPFLRSTVADISKAANIPTIMLPVIDVNKFLDNSNPVKKM